MKEQAHCNLSRKIGIFSFFSGAGFLDLGFELSGLNVVYASEINADFMQAYSYARSNLGISAPVYGCHTDEGGDIAKLTNGQERLRLSELIQDARQTADVIGFIGGPPCPDFSIGGKNKGRQGDHGKLSGSYIELICQQKPDFFVFENVKGLWITKAHRAFYEELKFRLIKSGYILTERLINSIEYGVPQDRERIILIGFKDSFISEQGVKINKRFLSKISFPWNKNVKYPRSKVFSYAWADTDIFEENSVRVCPENIPQELTVEHWFRLNDVLNHVNAEHHFKPRAGIKRFMSISEGDNSGKSFKRLHRWRYSPTVCYGNNEVHLHPYKVRRISVAEALSLQSLPRDFILPPNISLTKMFKIIGNGVPYIASKAIAEVIVEFLSNPQYYYEQIDSGQLELSLMVS